jgi:hypothetical protein
MFREHFAALSEQYVLIGGTAATLAMAEAGLDFRATKDLDIVLHIEALSPNFGTAFWTFVEHGGYEIRQASDTGKPVLYRFKNPADEFVAEDGSINEVDALILSSDRLYLIEVKSWRGVIGGNQHTWTIRNAGRERAEENQLLLANRKRPVSTH